MTTVAVIVCDGERFRVLDNGQVQRFTDSGWEMFVTATSDGIREDDGELVMQDVRDTLLSAAQALHFLYGWKINEVNVDATQEEFADLDGGLKRMTNMPSVSDASVNFVGDHL